MIKRLKIKFVALAMSSLFVLLLFIITGINVINYSSVVRQADTVLSVLSQNKGAFPEAFGDKGGRISPHITQETPHESRYFSVVLDQSSNAIQTETGKIASVDKETAVQYALAAANRGKKKGFIKTYRFNSNAEGNTVRIIFLECGRQLNDFFGFLYTSIIMALAGLIVVFFVISFFADRIIKPIAESYEKQKRFITDAGHEIKTPLTIINANADVLEMDIGENEYPGEIKQQAKRLTGLTNDLVYLARMEEAQNTVKKIDFPLSDIVAETVQSFKTLALTQQKKIVCNIQPMLSLRGDNKAIEQLVSVLMDNAVKYSPKGETISVSLAKLSRNIQLCVQNVICNPVTNEQLSQVFNRFYRTDPSRNSATGGHGIGLSVAKAITSAHGGKIFARTDNGETFTVYVIFPAQ